MATVRLQIPETQFVELVEQLSPAAKKAVLAMLVAELGLDADDLEFLVEYAEPFESWDLPDSWDEDEEAGLDRQQLLAAETFHYSYANYDNHLGIGNVRFDELMPDDVDTLEMAEQEGWDDAQLAQALDIEEEHVEHWRRSYQRAKSIVDAPTPAESFRRGVRYSIQDALEDGLTDEQEIEDLVVQICYRAADLAYLLDVRGETLAEYSEELRKE